VEARYAGYFEGVGVWNYFSKGKPNYT